jgi:hypothetical protein
MKPFLTFIFIIFSVTSCSQAIETQNDPLATSLIIESSNIYSLEDVKNAGWKEFNKFNNSEYPETVEIAYGFFKRKDIEVWVYKSPEAAKKLGIPYGDEAVEKRAGQTDYMIPRVNRYHAYVIVGNLMLLCETETLDCQKLIDNF